jgi:ribosomal protein L7Ae-like RNA K-turn-binding protein
MSSLSDFNTKKCDSSRGQNSWTVDQLKQLCITLKIDYHSSDKKADFCNKIARYFRKLENIPSPILSPSIILPPSVLLPQESVIGSETDSTNFFKKKCDASRGQNAWTVVDLKGLCNKFKIDYKSNDKKDDLCKKLSRYFKKSSDISMPSAPVSTPVMPVSSDLSSQNDKSELTILTKPVISESNISESNISDSNNFFKKKCDASIGQNAWTVVDLKGLCNKFKIDYKSNDKKDDLCKKLSRYFKKSSLDPNLSPSPVLSESVNTSEFFIDNSGSEQTMMSSNSLSREKINFLSKKCDSTRGGKNAWTIAQLRELCVKLQINYTIDKNKFLTEKENLCQKLSHYFKDISIVYDRLPEDVLSSLVNPVEQHDLTLDNHASSKSKNMSGVMSLQSNYIDKLKQQFGSFTRCKNMSVHELVAICGKLNIDYTIFDTQTELCNKIKKKIFSGIQTMDMTNFECDDHTFKELTDMAKVLGIIVDNQITKDQLCNQINNKLHRENQITYQEQPQLMDSTFFGKAKQTLSDLFVAQPQSQIALDINTVDINNFNPNNYTYGSLRKAAGQLGIPDTLDLPEELGKKVYKKLVEKNLQFNKIQPELENSELTIEPSQTESTESTIEPSQTESEEPSQTESEEPSQTESTESTIEPSQTESEEPSQTESEEPSQTESTGDQVLNQVNQIMNAQN